MPKYIMALDAGTTSNRCILFDHEGNICSMAQKEFRQIFPNPGWVEHDANEIWSTQLGVAVEAMSKIGATATILPVLVLRTRERLSLCGINILGNLYITRSFGSVAVLLSTQMN